MTATTAAGLTFQERMAGGFTLGERDPAEGARAGTAAGRVLTLRARVVIPDVRRFVADPQHAGGLDGSVTFPPIGDALATDAGRVRLFTPTSDPDLKLMEYRVAFVHEGRSYCLDGAKQVRRGSLLRSWSATTTLPCRLHDGPDPSGPVVGAGVLRLTPWSFLGQLASFRAVHAATAGAGVLAHARFLQFFSGQLIDTYLRAPEGR